MPVGNDIPTGVSLDKPFRPLVDGWLATIKLAQADKKSVFGDDAEEAMKFFNGPANYMFSEAYLRKKRRQGADGDLLPPSFQICMNKLSEIVQLFGPTLYHRNPNRLVTPRNPPVMPPVALGNPMDPMVQQGYQMLMQKAQTDQQINAAKASILEYLLNYTPNELDLKWHSRRCLDEALIKGMGVMWTEVYQPANLGFRMVGSFYDSVDNLQLDPDAETWEEVMWVARKRTLPVWEAERRFGWEPDSLKGNLESRTSQGMTEGSDNEKDDRNRGESNDLIEYWEIYSKMGLGDRLQKTKGFKAFDTTMFGDYSYLCIAKGVDQPLNLPDAVLDAADIQVMFDALQWPIPFWIDGAWPFEAFYFHAVPNEVWPMSHVKPGMGELQFLNWAISYLATRVRISCRDFIGVMKSAGEDLKNAILNGPDFTLLEIEDAVSPTGRVTDVVSFLQHPQVNGDIWAVIAAVAEQFDKRMGLNELMYGMASSQSRSAADINVRSSSMSVRPDDMASQVEDSMTRIARKEALASRWVLEGPDVAPQIGPECAYFWEQLMMTSDPVMLARELDCRIEAGSMKKPNKNLRIDQMNNAIQVIGPALQGYGQGTGNTGPWNALISDWGKAMELDVTNYLLPAMPPPMPVPPPEGQQQEGPPQ